MSTAHGPNYRARAVAHRGPLDRPLVRVSRTVAVIDGRGAVGTRSVSLAGVACLADVSADDVDPRGTWGSRKLGANRVSVTAEFCGDPRPGRSALDMRGRG